MLRILKHHWLEVGLFFIIIILCVRNFTPHTYLTGWDNLHPEFNIWANIKRSMFSTWQEYQGLGLLAGMAHASDLVRQLIILPLTYIVPLNLIRYFWHFSMLFLGSFGLFRLSLYVTKNKYAAFISSLFYLLNFGTVQYFYLAFDPYSTFWGFFPWLIYELLLYLDHPKSFKRVFWINLLATPSFYVQTLFVVYFICVLIVLFINRKSSIQNLKVILIVLAINSFWLLPNIYFTLTRVSVTQNAMQNLMATDQFIEENQYRGHLSSFGLLQGQYYDIKNEGKPLMQPWQQHFSSLAVQITSYLLIIFAFLGVFTKNKYKLTFILILLFCLIGFLSDTLPFSLINHTLRQIPLLNQIFRNSFTKLLVPTVFSLSMLLSLSLSYFKKVNLLLLPLMIILSWPSFTGNFISPTLRNDIPQKYFQLFQYLSTKPTSKRILNLPQYNYWGWTSYKWGTNGSGFLWYGIDQPITDRAFDVWDNRLEDLYWQLQYCLNTRNKSYFQDLIGKYNISYILYDPDVFFPGAYNSGRVSLENEKLIIESGFTLEKQINGLKLYSTGNRPPLATYPSLPQTTQITFSHHDSYYYIHGPYQSNPSLAYVDNLFSNRPDRSNQNPGYTQYVNCSSSSSSIITAINQEKVAYYDCGANLDLSFGHVIKIDSQAISGRPLLIKVFSLQDHRLLVDSKLTSSSNPTYIYIPPIYSFDRGLGVNLSSLSLSQEPSINKVFSVDVSFLNWNQDNQLAQTPSAPHFNNYQQYNQTFYSFKTNGNGVYVLYQSFSPGWLAFYFDGLRPIFLKDHILINNWANGWNLNNVNTGTIYILFWPQLLEFLGFVLLIGTFVWIFKKH